MKKLTGLSALVLTAALLFAGCSNAAPDAQTSPAGFGGESAPASSAQSTFDTSKTISVVSREDGSGTRGAFIELFGLEVKGDDGSKKDTTTKAAIIANKTDVMLTNIAGNDYAVGYVSLGSLNDSIKAVQIDGVEPSAETVKNGTYKISRPFNIATKGEPEGLAKDFIGYIMSAEGQAVVAGGYIAIDDNAPAYAGDKPSGKIVVAGSSSVTPIMEKLQEAYILANPNATVEIQMSDSTAGMTGAIDGTCDIGMASRELKESELAQLTPIAIATDGIAVIVNKNNPVTTMTKEQVKGIFSGELTAWDAVK